MKGSDFVFPVILLVFLLTNVDMALGAGNGTATTTISATTTETTAKSSSTTTTTTLPTTTSTTERETTQQSSSSSAATTTDPSTTPPPPTTTTTTSIPPTTAPKTVTASTQSSISQTNTSNSTSSVTTAAAATTTPETPSTTTASNITTTSAPENGSEGNMTMTTATTVPSITTTNATEISTTNETTTGTPTEESATSTSAATGPSSNATITSTTTIMTTTGNVSHMSSSSPTEITTSSPTSQSSPSSTPIENATNTTTTAVTSSSSKPTTLNTTSTTPPTSTTTPENKTATEGMTTQSTQQTSPDPCHATSCGNGTCSVSNGSAVCDCKPGYTGNNCETNIDDCENHRCMNGGTCTDHVNNYTCQCAEGYDGQNCSSNIDDCESHPCMNGGTCTDHVNNYTCQCAEGYDGHNCSSNINECENNPCSNGGNCTDGDNDYTCNCAAGFDGKNCSIDIDKCENKPCLNGGNCTDGINSYTCHCAPGFDGHNCSVNIDECQSNPCENGGTCSDEINMYTCNCIDGFNGTNCENNIDDCVAVTCSHGGTCEDGINNFTCICAAEWEGINCETDVDECVKGTHGCHRNAHCTNTVGGYNCTCIPGFTGDGFNCEDTNECTNSTLCQNGATCFNTPGSYLCYCTEYWNGTHCQTDIDECTTLSSPCGDNAVCTNTDDGYNCTCAEGYRGDGHVKCFRETLITLPVSIWTTGDDDVFGPVALPEVVYYFGKPYNSFYVSMNGYITLGNYLNQRYPPMDSTAWDIADFPIIAPLWSDIVTKGQGTGVSFGVATDDLTLAQIGKAMGTSNPSLSIIVTWQKAVPYPFDQNSEHEAADFQVIISKVGVNTFLMFNYDQEFFTWKSATDKLVSVGYSGEDNNGIILFGANNFTEANENGFKGVNGRWVFDITVSTSVWGNEALCLNTVANRTLATVIESYRSQADRCPCSVQQVKRDRRFKHHKSNQYVSRFARGTNNIRQRCHYSESGSLMQGNPRGGYIETEKTKDVYKICCTDSTRCDLFYSINPSDTCSSYSPPSWSPSWGDPHITTLDGASYTFNARGEFTLLKLNQPSVNVQVRTELAKENNTDATVFVGLAAQVNNKDIVEVSLDKKSGASKIYINGIESVSNAAVGNVSITRTELEIFSEPGDSKTITIAFSIGMSIQITIGDILDIVTNVPKDGVFHGQTMGLLGNNNGNDEDDFKPMNDPDNPLNKTSSERDIYYKFGLTWRVQNETGSLFNYAISGLDFSYYNNDSIEPNNFISDQISNHTIKGYINKTCGYGTIDVTKCGDNMACVVDAAATCNETFGLTSKDTEDIAVKEKETLDHRPPDFKQPNPLYVGYSQNSSRTFTFEFRVDAAVKINNSGEGYLCTNCTSFSWNVSEALRVSPASLVITAIDSMNATSEYRPDIYYCGCMEESQCDFSLIVQDGPVGGSDGKFFRARCNCSEDIGGNYCETKIDRCAGTPCYEGVTCNSSIPANPCGPCPDGLDGDGSRCFDKNECYLGTSLCSQICENTNGSYTCKCESGYDLGTDGHSCNDINECERSNSLCKPNEYCENTEGSYECKCNPGYSNDTSKPGCVKGKASYGGILVFKTIVPEKEKIKTMIETFLTETYKNSIISVTYIEVVSVVEFGTATRKRRATDDVKWKADFVLHTDKTFSTEDVHKVLSDTFDSSPSDSGYTAITGFPILVSVSESVVYTDDEGGVCKIPGKTDCDPISTTCQSVNGTASCKCRTPYFNGWANPYTSCKDVDECLKENEICQGGRCVNSPGNYTCNCEAGYLYDGSTACKDMCIPNPCQNGGQCIHGDLQGQFLCKCDDMWTGPKCEDKNAEAEKLKIIAIAVGASIGAICLLLLLALCGMYRRHKNRYGGYRRRPLSSLDFDSSVGMVGSNLRTKDFPLDDDSDTTFNIPRPKYQQNGYDLDERGGASVDRSETGESGKMEEPMKRLTEKSSESSSGSGQDNPSFLHSDNLEAARRQSKRESKNAYDYF